MLFNYEHMTANIALLYERFVDNVTGLVLMQIGKVPTVESIRLFGNSLCIDEVYELADSTLNAQTVEYMEESWFEYYDEGEIADYSVLEALYD